MLTTVFLFLAEKSGEIVLTLLLEKILQQVLSDRNADQVRHFISTRIVILYFFWLAKTSDTKKLDEFIISS